MFCDWLSVWQYFPDWKGGDFLGGRIVSIEGACGFGHRSVIDPTTGELSQGWAVVPDAFDDDDEGGNLPAVDYELAKFKQHRGSFETSLNIRMINGKLEVRGNPSAWGRMDNLFGLGIDDGIAVYNEILSGLGLPEFTPGEFRQHWLQASETWKKEYTGANIIRADITQNQAVGMGNVADHHKWIASQKVYRHGPDDADIEQFAKWEFSTVYSSESKYWVTHKHYDKALALEERTLPEYVKKLKNAVREGRMTKSEAYTLQLEAEDYLSKLAEWCAEIGVSRSEVQFRSRWFAQNEGMGYWTPCETESRLFDKAEEHMGKIACRGVVHQVDSMDRLTDGEFRVLDLWRKGEDVTPKGGKYSRSAFYRFRTAILEKTGYDIAARPVNVSKTETRVVFLQVRPLLLRDAPIWYQKPSYPGLRLAA
jgi:hypothetical protein